MMKFRTEITGFDTDVVLDPRHPSVLIGSCFAENISRKMHEHGWEVFNDAGTLYNPISIAKVLRLLLFSNNLREIMKESIFENGGIVHSWLFDTHFSAISDEALIEKVEKVRIRLIETLKRAESLFVTFGTSWCYYLSSQPGYIVANCHKMPPQLFQRKRLSIEEIFEEWKGLIELLKLSYPQIKVIFTVSPVRHLKDGFAGNSRSKATLLLSVERLCLENSFCHYFPAYEIVCDDLRDYRFYASDLIHPSESAVEYIWEIFRSCFVDSKGESILKEGNRHYKATHHRPIFRPDQ